MDKHNLFLTQPLYRLVRLDWLCIMLVLAVLVAVNWQQVNWLRFWVMFWVIDAVGTVPGFYYYFRNRHRTHGVVPNWCVVAYNTCHSFATTTLVLAGWYYLSGPEWAMLGMPIHLAGDRGVFGNIYKNFGVQFEASGPHEGFRRFLERFASERGSTPARETVHT